jgi:hypothetical protein
MFRQTSLPEPLNQLLARIPTICSGFSRRFVDRQTQDIPGTGVLPCASWTDSPIFAYGKSVGPAGGGAEVEPERESLSVWDRLHRKLASESNIGVKAGLLCVGVDADNLCDNLHVRLQCCILPYERVRDYSNPSRRSVQGPGTLFNS